MRYSMGLGALVFASLLAAAPVEARPLRASHTIKVKAGYLDSHFAVSPNGAYLAYIHVDQRKPTYLIIRRIVGRTSQQVAKVNITKFTMQPTHFRFAPDSKRLLITKEVAHASPPILTGVLYDLAGRRSGLPLGRFHQIAFRKLKNSWQVVTYIRNKYGAGYTHDFAAYSYPVARRIKFARIFATAAGAIARPPMEIGFLSPDLSKIFSKVAGKYDRKRDVRLPDREKAYDVFTRKFTSDREISNTAAWTKLRDLRRQQTTQANLLEINGSQKSYKFTLLSQKNQRKAAADTTPPLKQFNFSTFSQQATASGKTIFFSFTIDPQWPTLFGRSVSVPEVFHLFRYDVKSNRTTLKATIKSPGQVLNWSYGGGRLAIMRLHKYWKLGHHQIEIFRVK